MTEELLERDKIDELLKDLEGWRSIENHHIIKEFEFPNLKSTSDFITKVEEISDKLDHHPDVEFSDEKIIMKIYTHSADGLTEKDFELAKEIEKVID